MAARYSLARVIFADRVDLASRISLCALGVCAAIFGANFARQVSWPYSHNVQSAISQDRADKDLYLAAISALGGREGAVIVIDPQTGRIRAVVNPELAFGAAFPPGSTIKPFSALAALRTGAIASSSRILCRQHYVREDFETVCSHPRDLPPLGATEAIAYSCNYYFGKLGEQLRESSVNSTLAEFGFGQQTGINWTDGKREAAGKLPCRQWRAQNALGEGDQIQVSPIQLLTAYSALVNGGQLFVPRIATGKDFVPQPRAEIKIDDQHRQLIVEGMRGSVRYGTAERAGLHSLPLYAFGKTGTSTQIGGFRTQGWFLGFASPLDDDANQNHSAPKNVKLALIVFLKRGHGSDAAELARPIFEAYVRAGGDGDGEKGGRGDRGTQGRGDGETGGWGDGDGETGSQWIGDGETGGQGEAYFLPVAPSPRPPVAHSLVRVHLVRENETRTMTLEDYVLGVVATEGSTETEPEALKALAVAARTYALKNLRRHVNEDYDFCTTTHCQRYRLIDPVNADSQVSSEVINAVRQTAGEVLHYGKGQIVDSYFSASCGGATANIGTLWGVRAPSYLTGGQDEFCLTMPHHSWTDVISSADLHRALRSDARTDVGGRLASVVVSKQDRSGRAESITICGERRRTVSGWDFKIIVGRALGWNLLKSSRFEIKRSGSDYVFRGSGFGHGLGLCQEGAHVMARRGASYQRILTKYFPATHVDRKNGKTARHSSEPRAVASGSKWASESFQADLLWNSNALECADCGGALDLTRIEGHWAVNQLNSKRRRAPLAAALQIRRLLSSEHFRIGYPEDVRERDAEYALRILESSRSDLLRRVAAAGVSFQFPALELFINETTGDFVGRTGQPPWVAAATRGNRIELQPLELLKRRRILETTLRHELVHALVDSLGSRRTPRWLSEGLAIHVAGEGQAVSRYLRQANLSIAELEQGLSNPTNAEEMRAAYAAAYREVTRLIRAEGEAAVWRRVFEASVVRSTAE